MKRKIKLLVLLTSAFVINSKATSVITGGCTKRLTYQKVEFRQDEVICLGIGSIFCPSATMTVEGVSKKVYPMDDIICYVFDCIGRGIKDSETRYMDDVPLRWKSLSDGNVKIDVEDGKSGK